MQRVQPPPTATARSKSQRKEKPPPEVPAIIVDQERQVHYEKGKFLGKGGFAHCYEIRNKATGEVLAGKVVPKQLLVKQYQRDKMAQEVQIHRNLSHRNVVKLFHFFEVSVQNFQFLVQNSLGSFECVHHSGTVSTKITDGASQTTEGCHGAWSSLFHSPSCWRSALSSRSQNRSSRLEAR